MENLGGGKKKSIHCSRETQTLLIAVSEPWSFSHFSPRSSPFVTPIIAPTFVFSQPSKTPPSEIITSFHPSTFHGIHVVRSSIYEASPPPPPAPPRWGGETRGTYLYPWTEIPSWNAERCRTGRRTVTHTLPVVLSGSITGGGGE